MHASTDFSEFNNITHILPSLATPKIFPCKSIDSMIPNFPSCIHLYQCHIHFHKDL